MGLLVTPPAVEFHDVKQGDIHTCVLTIKNTEQKVCTLRLRPPKGQFFSTRGFVPSQRLAPGFEVSFEIIFDSTKGTIKEFTSDMVTIQSDFGDRLVSLKAMMPQPLLELLGDLHFGIIPCDSKASKKLKLSNKGTAVASYTVDWDKALPLVIEPANGELGPGETVELVASLTFQDMQPGPVAGDMTVLFGDGKIAELNKKLNVSASLVKTNVELLDPAGIIVNDVQFGQHYFGETLTRQVFIYNNAPTESKFLLSYGSAGEMKGKGLVDDSGGVSGTDPDDPYAGFINAARQKVRARATNDNPFTVTPQSGTVAPYSKMAVTVVFTPQGMPISKGFAVTAEAPEQQLRSFDYLALLEFSGGSYQKLRLPIKGKGLPGGLAIEPPTLDFGNVAAHCHVDHIVNLVNLNARVAVDFKVDKSSPYYSVEPSTGRLLGGQTMQLHVRYAPKAMGQHPVSIIMHAISPLRKAEVQLLSLAVVGTSLLRPAVKEPLVGGPDKLPKDFIKPKAYADGQQILESKLAVTKKSTKATTQLCDRPDAEDSFAIIGNGTHHAMSKTEFVTTSEHRDKYIDVIRSKRTSAKVEKDRRQGKEDDVNLGMDSHSGLKAHEPRLPKGRVDPLWTAEDSEKPNPSYQRVVPEKELESIPTHRDHPTGELERIQCAKELTRQEIKRLIMGPKVIDFGSVSVGSQPTQHLMFVNPLDCAIHVVLDLKTIPELRGSRNTSQVIPPNSKAKFPLQLSASDVKEVNEHVDYCINSMHILNFQLTASVVPVSVDISSDELHFAFALDNWDDHVQKMFVVDNPHKFPIEYTLESTSPTFSVSPESGVLKAQTSVEAVVKWAPPLDGSVSGLQQGHIVLSMLGGDAPRRVFVQGQLPEGALKVKEKALDAGQVPVGSKQKVEFYIKNGGSRDSSYRINPPALEGVTIQPVTGRIGADEGLEIEVEFFCSQPGPMAFTIEVCVQGGKPLKLPFKAEGVLPCVNILQELFAFGAVNIGNAYKLQLTLANLTPVPAIVAIDLTKNPEFQIELQKDAWSPAEYDTCPLMRLGTIGMGGMGFGSQDSSRRMSRRESRSQSSNGGGGPQEGARFHITLHPDKSLELQLVFRPVVPEPAEVALVASILTTGSKVESAPVQRMISGNGVQPRIVLSKCVINFGTQFVIRSNQTKMPYTTDIYVTNACPSHAPVRVSFGAPVFKIDSSEAGITNQPKVGAAGGVQGGVSAGAHRGVFVFEPDTLTVDPGEMIGSRLSFTPRDDKTYEATVPVYLDDDHSVKYLQLEIYGSGQNPRLSFDTRECVLPPTPLGLMSTATFHILNHGYDNLDLRYRLPADESHVPMQISFPEGNLIGIAKDRLPVVVSFTSGKPLSFTANIDFMDEEGKRFAIPISGTTDNCILTLQAFMEANPLLQLQGLESEPLMLEEDPNKPFKLPGPLQLLGSTNNSANLCRFLNATTTKGPYTNMAQQMVASRGRMIVELVEILSGKPFPGKITKLPSNKKEAAEALLGLFDAMLVFLKSHGALLNAVKPEMLLDSEDLDRVLTGRGNKALKPEELDALGMWDEVEEMFPRISMQAWNSVVMQVFKVFVLGRVTLKSFKSLPGIDNLAAASLVPADSSIIGSNLYSVPESVLLAWMSVHYMREYGSLAHRLTNFDEDLKSGLVLFSLLSGYWPALTSRKEVMRSTPVHDLDFEENNELVVRLMGELGISIEVTATELANPKPAEMLVLVLYLYQVLPQFVPKTSIDFTSRLGELAVKELELTNPSKKAISYTIKLEGHRDFTTEVNVVHIDAKSSVRLPVKCLPTTSVAHESRLVLMSRKDGGANAATLVFLLNSQVKTRSPLKRIRTEGPLYELQHFEFAITNPYPEDCEFNITLLHEQAELVVKAEPEPKRRGGMAPAQPKNEVDKTPEGPKKEMFPSAFGLDRNRMRLKKGGTEKMKAFFLPFVMGQHFCTIICKDKDQGEFVYELVGDTTLPAPSMELKALLPLEGPAIYDVVVPFTNSHLETAKRMFMEKHPLAKDKEQAALLKADALKVLDLEYTVAQTNSLITCSKFIALTNRTPDTKEGDKKLPGSRPQSKQQDSAEAGPAQIVNPSSEVPSNGLRLLLKPIGTGVYPSRLLLTSTLDTRVIDVELMAQTLMQQFQLEFNCACRQMVAQDVPLVNTSDRLMAVVAKIEGPAWTGIKEVSVPAGSTLNYNLQFKPTRPGDQKGSLELTIPATGERNIYTLIGRVAEPIAEGNIRFELKARTSATRQLGIPNLVGGAVEYKVMCDVDFVSGMETCKLPSSQAGTYKLTVTPPFSGTYYGTISFLTDDGATLWYSVEVHVSEPPEVGIIDLSAKVREAVAIYINVVNPVDEECEMKVVYSSPSLIGPQTLVMPGGSKELVPFEFFYSPLLPGDFDGSLTLINKELGEYIYLLKMHAEPAQRESLPEVTAAVGFKSVSFIKVENPLPKTVTVKASSSNPQNFSVRPSELTLGPFGVTELKLEYTPCSLDEEEESVVCVGGGEMGTWEYHVVGRGTMPEMMETVKLSAPLAEAAQKIVTWKNPFPKPVQIQISLSPTNEVGASALSLVRKQAGETSFHQTVPGFGEAHVPINFTPSTLRTATADLKVSSSRESVAATTVDGQPLVWRFPIQGLPEMNVAPGSQFGYKCKARSVSEERMEIVLTGLASVDVGEEFLHEVSIPPEYLKDLPPGVLAITPVEARLSAPDQPLIFALTFAPQRMFSAEVEFVVSKASGGRWCFEILLQATEPDLDGTLTIEAAMDQTSSVPLYLYSTSSQPQPFTIGFTAETPLQFDVTPSTGFLAPKPEDGVDGPPSGPPALEVMYTGKEIGKVVKGRLYVQTSDMQYSYDLRGKMPAYRPPHPSEFQPTVESHLAPEVAVRLAEAHDQSKRPNFVAKNTKAATVGGRSSRRPKE